MKLVTIKQNSILTLFTIIFIATSSFSNRNIDNGKFLIEIERTDTGLKLLGIKGTAFKELSFSLRDNYKQIIDEFGMVLNENSKEIGDKTLADFEIVFVKNKNSYTLESKRGTAWTKLGFSFSENNKVILDEKGVIVK